MVDPTIEAVEEGVRAQCGCGWAGELSAVEAWAIETDRDRIVRRCPDCGEPRPEWGAFSGLDGVRRVAWGPLRRQLEDAGVLSA